MPKMVLKQESRLNGVKTNIFNLDEVAKALRVQEEGKFNHSNIALFSLENAVYSPIYSDHQVLVCWVGRKQGEDHYP